MEKTWISKTELLELLRSQGLVLELKEDKAILDVLVEQYALSRRYNNRPFEFKLDNKQYKI